MLVFVDVLRLETDNEVTIEQIRTAADLWVGSQPCAHNITDGRHGRLRFISNAKQWLGFLGRLHLPKVPLRPYANLVDEFANLYDSAEGLVDDTLSAFTVGGWGSFSIVSRSNIDLLVRSLSAISMPPLPANVSGSPMHGHRSKITLRPCGSFSTMRSNADGVLAV